jgi:hypothetical protein
MVAVGVARGQGELAPGMTEQQLRDGWISLFDGRTLFGWKEVVDANWKVEQGAIVVSEGPVGLLRTTSQFSDYILQLEFRAPPETNSGVFLRTSPEPTDVKRDCYELNIAPADNPFPTGSLVGRSKVEQAATTGEWQTFEVRVERDNVQVSLDGRQVLTYRDPRPLGRGFIGLQHNQGRVEFRNIRLKPLGLEPLLEGTDLSQWDTSLADQSRFEILTDGQLQISGGPGQLESRGRWGDFVLQIEAMTQGDGLNSGLFFRSIPGDRTMGYESQIHHGYIDGDRSRPQDFGTGGIFRRQPARRVMPDDHAWFYKTLVVEGPHMAVWVNGLQVTDWTDSRPKNQNPRRGLRLEPGTIILQGHDPSTRMEVREIQIGELIPRRPRLSPQVSSREGA